MGCTNCSYDSNGTPKGCGDKGHCSSGSCNKRNTYDWINTLELDDPMEFNMVEVSFKKGSRKEFFIKKDHLQCQTGDMVLVESSSGYDLGRVSLSGELVRLQMKKKRVGQDRITLSVIRKANERDLEKLEEARALEKEAMVKARAISRSLGLEMKVGDVEYQGDKKKATFFYTADGRVDFRELVRSYAKEFKVKIEMRQIGARQESARIGGIGACGRELCCSTWLSDFKSVSTTAARYQNISINQTKLSGQCGRLKCCLNYELDSYMDALEDFPRKADRIKTKKGNASLIKTNIFKGLLYYSYDDPMLRGPMAALTKQRVKDIQAMNKAGEYPEELLDIEALMAQETAKASKVGFADVTGEIELPETKRRRKGSKNKGRGRSGNKGPSNKRSNKGNSGSKSSRPSKGKDSQGGAQKKSAPQGKDNKANSSDNGNKPTGDKAPKDGQKPKRNNKNKRRRPNNKKNNDKPSGEAKKDSKS